jgi:hypothetical protein
MKKEVFLAVTLGVSLGFIVTFGIWKARAALKTIPTTAESQEPTPTNSPDLPTPTSSQTSVKLVVTQPKENDLVNVDTILITGESIPSARIVILYEEGELVLSADDNGRFSGEISLVGGANEISVLAFDNSGKESRQDLTLVYSTAEI